MVMPNSIISTLVWLKYWIQIQVTVKFDNIQVTDKQSVMSICINWKIETSNLDYFLIYTR